MTARVARMAVCALLAQGCTHAATHAVRSPTAGESPVAQTDTPSPDAGGSEVSSPHETPSPYVWLGPAGLVAVSAASQGIAAANGMTAGRIALDSAGASVGAGIGFLGMFAFEAFGKGNDDLLVAIAAVPIASAWASLGGIALGEKATGHVPLPARTIWPAFGGYAVGAVVDIAALAAVFGTEHPSDAATTTTAILIPFAVGSTTVAGFSMGLRSK